MGLFYAPIFVQRGRLYDSTTKQKTNLLIQKGGEHNVIYLSVLQSPIKVPPIIAIIVIVVALLLYIVRKPRSGFFDFLGKAFDRYLAFDLELRRYQQIQNLINSLPDNEIPTKEIIELFKESHYFLPSQEQKNESQDSEQFLKEIIEKSLDIGSNINKNNCNKQRNLGFTKRNRNGKKNEKKK